MGLGAWALGLSALGGGEGLRGEGLSEDCFEMLTTSRGGNEPRAALATCGLDAAVTMGIGGEGETGGGAATGGGLTAGGEVAGSAAGGG